MAVLPVILYHAGFGAFSGGYIGVDVFFVISGYLISTIIMDDLDKGRFSLAGFYERRARRIFPALFLVVFACIPVAWLWMTAGEMRDFARSLIFVSVSATNFLFWRKTGYFDQAAELNPLLHTWSLAVEEQFYILFPLFLMLGWRLGKRKTLLILAALFALSLSAAQIGSTQFPSAAFYLLPTRAWELSLGVFCAFALRRGIQVQARAANALSALGLGLIAAAIFGFDAQTPTPSLYTLAPNLGVCLIILFARPGTITQLFLSRKPLVGTGLISYSSYLWHQPIFAFYRVLGGPDDGTGSTYLGLALLSFILGYLTWDLVEKPFRGRSRFSRSFIVSSSAVLVAALLGFGIWGYASRGFVMPLGIRADPHGEVVALAFADAADVMVIGDSHAARLVPGLRKAVSGEVADLSSAGCIPFYDVDRYDSRFVKGACAKAMNAALDAFAASPNYRNLVLTSMGPVYLDGTPLPGKSDRRTVGQGVELLGRPDITDPWAVFETGLRTTLERLSRLEDRTIIVAIDVPELGLDYGCGAVAQQKRIRIAGLVLRDAVKPYQPIDPADCKIPRADYERRAGRYRNLVVDVAREFPSVKVFDPVDVLCDDAWCYGYREDEGYFYSDSDHLNPNGSTLVANHLAKLLH